MNNLREQRCLPYHVCSCAREALWDTIQLHTPTHPAPPSPAAAHIFGEKNLESESVCGWKKSPKSLIWQPGGQSSGQPLARCLAGSIISSPDRPLLWFALLIFNGDAGWVSFFFLLCLFVFVTVLCVYICHYLVKMFLLWQKVILAACFSQTWWVLRSHAGERRHSQSGGCWSGAGVAWVRVEEDAF